MLNSVPIDERTKTHALNNASNAKSNAQGDAFGISEAACSLIFLCMIAEKGKKKRLIYLAFLSALTACGIPQLANSTFSPVRYS